MRTWLCGAVVAALLPAFDASAQQPPTGKEMVDRLFREQSLERGQEGTAQPPNCDDPQEKSVACESRGFSLGRKPAAAVSPGNNARTSVTRSEVSSTAGVAAPSRQRASARSVPIRQEAAKVAPARRQRAASYAEAAASCAIDEASELGVNICATFARASSALTDTTRGALDAMAAMLVSDPRLSGRQLLISGHADATGDSALNQQLSTQRAQTVRDYLVSRGIPTESLVAVGRGEEEPISGRHPEDPMNRRVQMRVSS